MEYPRKRRAYDNSPTFSSAVIKKSKTGLDIDKLSEKQKAVIAEAAAILEVPLNNVPDALNTLRSSSARLTASPRRPRQRSSNNMGVKRPDLKPFKSLQESYSSSDSWEKGTEGSTPARHDLESESGFCGVDSLFGFSLKPTKWGECFASFASLESSSSDTNGCSNGGFGSSTTHYGTTPAFIDTPLSTQMSTVSTYQYPGHPSQNISTSEVVPNQDYFACDIEYASHLEQNYPALKPFDGPIIQPSASMQEMTYPATDVSLLHPSWHQDMDSGAENDSEYYFAKSEDVEVNGYSDHCWPSDEAQNSGDLTRGGPTGGPRRGPFRSRYEREQTAQTRKLTACMRCRMQRIRCIPDPFDPHGVCLTCKKVSNMKLSKLPCLRYKISEIKLFKPGQVPGMEWTSRWSNKLLDDISTWASTQTKKIQVTEGYSSIPLALEVSEFIPMEGDMLHRSWVSGGVKKSALIPAFAIVDLVRAEQAVKNYINQGGADFFTHALDRKDKWLWETYSIAIEKANNLETSEQEKKLLKMVLRLWIAIRITTRSIRISGDETLGMSKDILDETSPLYGSIPIPPVMGAQIELILIQKIQVPLRVQVLDALQKLILANKPDTWFTIYLCIFILLHNCAMITKHDAGYARKHGIQARFARPAMIAEYHMGANILLAYFHYCNKGLQPFALDGGGFDLEAAGLNAQQIRFVQKTREYLKTNKTRFEELKWQGAFENDHYFIAQLFEDNWKPRNTV